MRFNRTRPINNNHCVYIDSYSRSRRIFLLFPLTLSVDYIKPKEQLETRWLEWAWISEDYIHPGAWDNYGYWKAVSWTHSPH